MHSQGTIRLAVSDRTKWPEAMSEPA